MYLCIIVKRCVSVCDLTGLRGGAVGRHTPRTAPAALRHHNGELIKCVGLQSRYRMNQRRGVRHLTKHQKQSSSPHTVTHMTIQQYIVHSM